MQNEETEEISRQRQDRDKRDRDTRDKAKQETTFVSVIGAMMAPAWVVTAGRDSSRKLEKVFHSGPAAQHSSATHNIMPRIHSAV